MTFSNVKSGVRNSRYHPDGLPTLEFLWRVDQATVNSDNIVTSIPDATGNGHTLNAGTTGIPYNAVSSKFKTSTMQTDDIISDSLVADVIDPASGKKLVIYVVGSFNHKSTDPSSVRAIAKASTSDGYILRTQKVSETGDANRIVTYQVEAAGPPAKFATSPNGSFYIGEPQVLRYDIDYRGGSGTNYIGAEVEKAEALTEAAITGYSPTSTALSINAGSTTESTGEIAAIFGYYETDDINQGKHKHIVDWCHREFFHPFDISQVSGLEFYARGDRGVTTDGSNQVTALTDQAGNHNLTDSGTLWNWNADSQYFSTPTVSIQGDIIATDLNSSGFSPSSGEKMTVYIVGNIIIPPDDSTNSTRHFIQCNSSTAGWICRYAKGADSASHRLQQYVYNGAGAAKTQNGTAGELKSSVPQVFRFEIDGDGNNHKFSVDKNTPTTWSTTGFSPYTASLRFGHNTTTSCANMEIATMFAFIRPSGSAITEALHGKIVDWCNREFIEPFVPSDVSGLKLDLDSDKGITTNNVNRLFDATNNEHTANQDTSGARPALIEADADFNGHNSLSFDGTTDYMTVEDSADFELDTGLTIYTVMTSISGAGFTIPLAKRQSGGTDMSWYMRQESTGPMRFYTRNAANTTTYGAINTGHSSDGDGTARIFRARHEAGVDTAIRSDGNAENTIAAPDEIASSPSTVNIMTLNNGSTANIAKGKVARILIYKESIPDGSNEDVAIMAELNALYKGSGSSTNLVFGSQGKLVADFNPDINAGQAITDWADQSGNGNDAAQTSAARNPTYIIEYPLENSHGAVISDGASSNSDFLTIPSSIDFDIDAGFSMYFAGIIPENISGANKYMSVRWSGSVANRLYQFFLTSTSKIQINVRNAADTSWQHATSNDVVGDNRFHRVRFGWNGTDVILDVDDQARVTTAAADVASPTSDIGVTINGRSGTDGVAVLTSRWLFYKRSPNDLEHLKIMNYLKKEYAPRAFSNGFSTGLQNKKQI